MYEVIRKFHDAALQSFEVRFGPLALGKMAAHREVLGRPEPQEQAHLGFYKRLRHPHRKHLGATISEAGSSYDISEKTIPFRQEPSPTSVPILLAGFLS